MKNKEGMKEWRRQRKNGAKEGDKMKGRKAERAGQLSIGSRKVYEKPNTPSN
jgi:hypothetical protein